MPFHLAEQSNFALFGRQSVSGSVSRHIFEPPDLEIAEVSKFAKLLLGNCEKLSKSKTSCRIKKTLTLSARCERKRGVIKIYQINAW